MVPEGTKTVVTTQRANHRWRLSLLPKTDWPNGSSITTCTGLTPHMEDERPSRSSTRNSQEKRVGAEGERDNVKKRQNEGQAIFGLLHDGQRRRQWHLSMSPGINDPPEYLSA